jgi:hypothetical protein
MSGLVDNAISHDPVTRFLSQQAFTSKELGKVIKKTVREIETGEGVLIFDDTLQEPHFFFFHAEFLCHKIGGAF